MKRQMKPIKYYLFIFLLSVIIVAGYTLYMVLTDKAEIAELTSLFFVPLVFTGIYWLGDFLLDKIANKKRKVDYEAEFVREINKKMHDSNAFILEDYRKLQQDQKFQTSLKIAYQIAKNGETEQWTIEKLEKKFRPQTLEARAMSYVIEHVRYVRKTSDNSLPESEKNEQL
ncbi:MAG: hypothetical protein PHI01_01575 [Candidatus Izemoplasmatales bacterium]|nr:hypothetical protein [Candidatus Izemoplasmatales bacterium]